MDTSPQKSRVVIQMCVLFDTQIIFIFDDNNRLQGIEIRDKTSDKKIVKLESKTPTPGDTLTIVDQIFSNLRRKNVDK